MKTNLTGVGELQKEGVGSGDVIFPQGQVGGMRHNHPSHLYFGYERDSGAVGEAIWSSAILRFELASDEIVWTVERAHSRSPWRMRLFMKVDGRCHCGAIAYSADVEPEMASICHCTDCQCFSGAPFRASVPANVEDFRLLHGNPKIYAENCRQRRETPAGVLRRMRHVNLCVGIRKYDRAQLAARGDKATIRDSAAPADLVLLGAFVDARHQNSALFA
jgi:Glutathione-dependent formaldehyde-activating enzyme